MTRQDVRVVLIVLALIAAIALAALLATGPIVLDILDAIGSGIAP